MKFKILEKILDAFDDKADEGEIYYIYVNPTRQELSSREESKENRGVIDSNGDLYVEAKWSKNKDNYPLYSDWIHDTLLKHLHEQGKCMNLVEDKWYDNIESLKYGVGVQRIDDTLDFWVGESYDYKVIDFGKPQIEKLMELAKKKNPLLNFHPGHIYYDSISYKKRQGVK